MRKKGRQAVEAQWGMSQLAPAMTPSSRRTRPSISAPTGWPQEWHHVRRRADATEFVQIGERWLDVMACGATKRNAFLKRAWGATATGTLEPGDVLFFYTQRIHRAPAAPAIGSPRYTLFGAFCRKGKTAGKELTNENWQERWADVDAKSRKTRVDPSWLS